MTAITANQPGHAIEIKVDIASRLLLRRHAVIQIAIPTGSNCHERRLVNGKCVHLSAPFDIVAESTIRPAQVRCC